MYLKHSFKDLDIEETDFGRISDNLTSFIIINVSLYVFLDRVKGHRRNKQSFTPSYTLFTKNTIQCMLDLYSLATIAPPGPYCIKDKTNLK